MPRLVLGKRCGTTGAAILAVTAAVIELAVRFAVDRAGGIALNGGQTAVLAVVQTRDSVQQTVGIGVDGVFKQGELVAGFHDITAVHNIDAVGIAGHQPQIVGDDDDGETLVAGKLLQQIAFILVLAGGIGNLIDRVLNGEVVDYINPLFIDFAVFNFADILVCVGVALWVLVILLEEVEDKPSKER